MLDIMLFSPRISTRELAQLCRRLAISVDAGIDARTMWGKEAQRAKGQLRSRLEIISQAVNQGESLRNSLRGTGEFFPVLFREMVDVGEQTGKLEAIFAQLADHCQEKLKLRRQFLAVITWPMIELIASIGAIGFLIWITGVIRGPNPGTDSFDPLGLGLYGKRGLAIYLAFVFFVAAVVWMTISP